MMNKIFYQIAIAATLISAATFTSCKEKDEVSARVTQITLNRTEVSLPPGGMVQLEIAETLPAKATLTSVAWSSSNPSVASVDQTTGLVIVSANATVGARAIITATVDDGDVNAFCTVNVGEGLETDPLNLNYQPRSEKPTFFLDFMQNATSQRPANDPYEWRTYLYEPGISGLAPEAPMWRQFWDAEIAAGRLCAIKLRHSNAPLNGFEYPDTWEVVLSTVQKMDVVYGDFEMDHLGAIDQSTVMELVRITKQHPTNPQPNAWMLVYEFYPCAFNSANIWPSGQNRAGADNFYRQSGLNVASPTLYPYVAACVHTWASQWGENISPNNRAAMLWMPLHKFSLVKKELEDPTKPYENHLIVPHVTACIFNNNPRDYGNVPPERSDLIALIQHIRLRGANGFVTYMDWNFDSWKLGSSGGTPFIAADSWIRNYSNDEYRNDVRYGWTTFDDDFADGDAISILNLENDKTSGVEWSGVRNKNHIRVLISNLGAGAARVSFPDVYDLPAQSETVAAGEHQLFSYTIANMLKDGGFDSGSAHWTTEYDASFPADEGVGGSPCLKLPQYGYALYKLPVKMEPGAWMTLSADVKSEAGENLQVYLRYYGRDDALLGTVTAQFDGISGNFGARSVEFQVPTNREVAFVVPILYNPSNGVFWVDNLTLKFKE